MKAIFAAERRHHDIGLGQTPAVFLAARSFMATSEQVDLLLRKEQERKAKAARLAEIGLLRQSGLIAPLPEAPVAASDKTLPEETQDQVISRHVIGVLESVEALPELTTV